VSIKINILKEASADNEEFYSALKSITAEVKELQHVFICTPLPGKFMAVISFLRRKNIPFEINPQFLPE
jgi:hypothetical protein